MSLLALKDVVPSVSGILYPYDSMDIFAKNPQIAPSKRRLKISKIFEFRDVPGRRDGKKELQLEEQEARWPNSWPLRKDSDAIIGTMAITSPRSEFVAPNTKKMSLSIRNLQFGPH